MASAAEVDETIDFVLTIALAYRTHEGRARMMKKVARTLRKKYKNGTPRKYCELVEKDPEGTFFLVNSISHGHFQRYVIKDNNKTMP
jgi:hypothetical protein